MAAITELDTENADRNLTSEVAVLTNTPDASNAILCQGIIYLGDGTKDLTATGGDFTVRVTVGGNTINGGGETRTLGTQVRATIVTEEFPVPANAEVIIYVTSPNGGDTDVGVTAYLYDVGPADVSSISTLIGTPVTDIIADLNALIGTPSTSVIDDMNSLIGTPATDLASDIANISTLIGTPGTDLTTDISDLSTGISDINTLIGTPATDLATDISDILAEFPTDFSSLVIDGAGAVNSMLQGFLTGTITETTGDNIATNFVTFWDNADALTAQTVDDVGGGAGGDATEAKQDQIIAAVITNAAGTDIAADIIALKAETVLIVADTNELQTDWADGGRLDLIVDIIAVDTTTDIPALIATAQADLDIVTGTDGALLDATNDVYHALIEYTFDDPVDEYTATWFKNGARVTSGITSPVIQVVKRVDGTDLVASIAMTEIGSTGSYKYDESTNVIVVDEAYLAIVSGTIDGSSRSFACLVRRS